ncbi:hypothetical protein SCLCIDRAFT_1037766 [Scleroderma citrinum Foug A]|uniref:Uncharacterized protein n=1 Tax=Scleroderma citrinum Foug A TaxID=1036808 RepID=A0A0C3DSC7_9AGAM|nr:hypothetical protein SCLCIDRAFT_1037766 [Scleroderma citrinum Foug A]
MAHPPTKQLRHPCAVLALMTPDSSCLSIPQDQRVDQRSLMPSSVSLGCSTAITDSGIPQNSVPSDKPTRQVDMLPLSPEELGEKYNKTQGRMPTTFLHSKLNSQFGVGWARHIHPEGAKVTEHSQGVLTRCDLRTDQELHGRITQYSSWLYDQLWQYPNLPQFHHLELVIEIVPKSQDAEDCQYYFVDHSRRVVFWLCEYKPSPIYHHVEGVQAEGHIELAIETQYWLHCELFPHITLDVAICQPLREILIHSISEAVLSDSPLAPYPAADLQQLLDLTSNITLQVKMPLYRAPVCM